MKISDKGLALIQECEGYLKPLKDGSGRCTAYQEVLGHKDGKPILDIPTIGWGCTKGVKMGDVWTRDEATEALRRELEEHERIVQKVVTVDMTQGMFDGLVSFQFNCGKLPGSTLLKLLNKGDVAGAAEEFRKFNRAGGVVQPGLVRRRSLEKARFLEPDGDERHAAPQTVDAPKRQMTSVEKTAAATATLEVVRQTYNATDPINTARKTVDKGKEIKSVVEDARGLGAGLVPKSLPLPFVGVGMVIAAVLFIGVVVVRARGSAITTTG